MREPGSALGAADRLAELEAENAFLRRALELAGAAMRAKDRELERLKPDGEREASEAGKLSQTARECLQDLARIGAFDEIKRLRDIADELLPKGVRGQVRGGGVKRDA